jgi:hypothetical protein
MSGLDRTMDLLESPGSAQGHASKYAGQSWPWPALQRAHGRRRPDHLRPRLQDGTRRHCVEGQGLDLSFRPIDGLAQVQEPSGTGGYGVGLPCPSLQHLQQPAPAARDDLIALWCGLRDAQPTQPSSRAELQQARLALGLRRAQRGQSSASQLATNPRQRLWCHLARARVPDTANRVPVLDSGSQLKKRKDSDCHPPLPTGGGLPVCTGPSSEIRIGKAERERKGKKIGGQMLSFARDKVATAKAMHNF